MQTVKIGDAKTRLSQLIADVENGDEVIIQRGDTPVAKLVKVEKPKRKFGILNGKLGKAPDFLEPMSEDELRLWEGGTDE